jgi:hypothetical protein
MVTLALLQGVLNTFVIVLARLVGSFAILLSMSALPLCNQLRIQDDVRQ